MVLLLFPCLGKRDDCRAKEVITERIIVIQPARSRDMQPVSTVDDMVLLGYGSGCGRGLYGLGAVSLSPQLWDSRNFEAVLVDDIEGERLVPDGRCAAA